MSDEANGAALERLQILVGEWEVTTSLEVAPGTPPARASFEWVLDRKFLLQRTEIPVPEAPDALSVISTDPESGAYTQHYFDSRGVVRVYEMELDDDTWTLLRTKADFTELPFSQRYKGRFEDGGERIVGQWEKAADGANWEVDFELSYSRVSGDSA